jgi:hypothetical protein
MPKTWSNLRDAAAAVAARWRAQVTRIRVPPLSAEWLRRHAIDADKHADGW